MCVKEFLNMHFEKIKEDFPEFIFEIEIINSLLEDHSSRHIDKIYLPAITSNKQLLGRTGIIYLQMIMSRSKNLIQGFLESLDRYNPLMAFLSTRAHYEVTASLAYFLKKLKIHYDSNNKLSFKEIQNFIYELTLGSRLPGFNQEYKSKSVMSLIDAVNDLLRERKKEQIFRKFYDVLSEFCHPNYHGIAMSLEVNLDSVTFNRNPEFRDNDIHAITYLLFSVQILLDFYDEALELLRINEELPVIVCNLTGRTPT
jgi:hypothetical protein